MNRKLGRLPIVGIAGACIAALSVTAVAALSSPPSSESETRSAPFDRAQSVSQEQNTVSADFAISLSRQFLSEAAQSMLGRRIEAAASNDAPAPLQIVAAVHCSTEAGRGPRGRVVFSPVSEAGDSTGVIIPSGSCESSLSSVRAVLMNEYPQRTLLVGNMYLAQTQDNLVVFADSLRDVRADTLWGRPQIRMFSLSRASAAISVKPDNFLASLSLKVIDGIAYVTGDIKDFTRAETSPALSLPAMSEGNATLYFGVAAIEHLLRTLPQFSNGTRLDQNTFLDKIEINSAIDQLQLRGVLRGAAGQSERADITFDLAGQELTLNKVQANPRVADCSKETGAKRVTCALANTATRAAAQGVEQRFQAVVGQLTLLARDTREGSGVAAGLINLPVAYHVARVSATTAGVAVSLHLVLGRVSE